MNSKASERVASAQNSGAPEVQLRNSGQCTVKAGSRHNDMLNYPHDV